MATRELNEKLVYRTIKELRESSRGHKVWRVRDPKTKAFTMEFAEREEYAAADWFADRVKRFPETYGQMELVLVTVQTESDRLMKRAATLLAGFVARDRRDQG